MRLQDSLLLLLLAASAATGFAQPVTYAIDPGHSSVGFSVRHMMVSNTKGEFGKFEGKIVWDARNPAASQVEVTIDIGSVNTREPRRDADLKGPEFFDAARFPAMTFKSKEVRKSGDGLVVKGNLTIRDVTKEVTLAVDGPTPEVKDQRGRVKIGASAITKINRKEFGLRYNQLLEAGGVVVGDEVTITLEIEATRQ